MELNISNNDDARSTMEHPITDRGQDQEVDGSLNDNEERLESISTYVAMLLSTGNVDDALSLARDMTATVPASSTAVLYQRLTFKVKELSDKMDQAAASMATLCDSVPKIDYINRLPFDIVTHIVYYLWGTIWNKDVTTTPAFLHVSKHWRKAILESTPFLSYQLPATKLLCHGKPTVSPARIRRMTIRGRVLSFSQLLGIHLVNLQHLCIDISGDTTSCYENYDRSCARGVCTAVRHNYNLDEVMERCPNLVSLKWSGCPLNGGSGKQYPQLRALQLREDEDELDELCEKLPSLVVISIPYIRDIHSLDRVSKYCPSLKCLKYNAPPDDVIQWPYEWDTSLEQGIQEFFFHGDGYDEDDAVYVIQHLQHASKTLKYLQIGVGGNTYGNYSEAIPLLQDTTFPHLIHLTCDPEYYEDERELLLSIIRRSPCLETFKSLQPFIMWYEPEPVSLMESCTRLVNTTVIMEQDQEHLNALKRFLNMHIQRGGYSTLRSLSIALWTDQCAQQLLPLIMQLTLLEELHLAVSLYSPLGIIMDWIATTNAMKIQQLKISIVGVRVRDPIFARLQHAHYLRSLIIDADRLCVMAALSLLEVSQLVDLQIPFEGLNDLVIDILRKQFPNLKELESHHIWR
ncbi:predicted protein [Lichtheimia corymbifera JMRC:FSU:9682]|uniref:F-box domain-containing protein n=1 Tax=Lichtheimia corymbifera JMRC:FSU:9682 TaxID=1263082 RepID=A0A068RZ12_9FUNG|nr:predicted protein [Lichtheimia corymbifera JMRC:FSU:9682]